MSSYSIHKAWRLVSELCHLLLRQVFALSVSLPFTPFLVFLSQEPPQQTVNQTCEANQTECGRMAFDETRSFASFVYWDKCGKHQPGFHSRGCTYRTGTWSRSRYQLSTAILSQLFVFRTEDCWQVAMQEEVPQQCISQVPPGNTQETSHHYSS